MLRAPVLVIALLLLLTGCSESPTGRTRLAFVPGSVMIDMGAQAFTAIERQRPLASDAVARGLVQCVAQEVIAAADEAYPDVEMPESWRVAVFEDPSPNAFALPGGRIGVNTGLLPVAENASQLAAVIGHEVAHVLADHGNERLTQELGFKAVFLVIGLFSDSRMEQEQLLRVLGLGAQLGVALPFSRAHEREADRMGLEIMATAGFEPRESVALWRNMAAQGGEQSLEFLSTHPAHDTRIEHLEAHMDVALERAREASPPTCPA